VTLVVMNGEDRREVEVTLGSLPNDVVADLPTAPYKPKDNATLPKDAPRIGHFTDKSVAHEHDYWAYVPDDYNPEHRYALVVWLQPLDSMETSVSTAWKSQCERRGIILLGPKAKDAGKGWNPSEADFVKELTEQFIEKYSIDKSRVVLHGYDSGGAFALHLAFKFRDLFRAVAAVAAPVREQPPDNEPEHRLQFLFMSGDADPVHKLVLGTVTGLRAFKFPVVHSIIEGGEHTYPSKSVDRIEEMARWVDSLDRI